MGLLDTLVSYDVEPFDPALFSYGLTPSAYPPDRSRPLFPTNIFFGWAEPSLDADIANALRQTTAALRAAAVADGQEVADAFSYGNYALFGMPVEGVYGANVPPPVPVLLLLPRLRPAQLAEIRKAVDPSNVMGLAGGYLACRFGQSNDVPVPVGDYPLLLSNYLQTEEFAVGKS